MKIFLAKDVFYMKYIDISNTICKTSLKIYQFKKWGYNPDQLDFYQHIIYYKKDKNQYIQVK